MAYKQFMLASNEFNLDLSLNNHLNQDFCHIINIHTRQQTASNLSSLCFNMFSEAFGFMLGFSNETTNIVIFCYIVSYLVH